MITGMTKQTCEFTWGDRGSLIHNGPHQCGVSSFLPESHTHLCGIGQCLEAQTPNGRVPKAESDIVKHQSGATSSHITPPYFRMPGEAVKLTALRFQHGNEKHENGNPVYGEANWMTAYRAKDYMFFRDRAGHALEHLWDEMQGKEDPSPGGNLGAVGWAIEVLAYVKVNDPEFYEVIQGKRKP